MRFRKTIFTSWLAMALGFAMGVIMARPDTVKAQGRTAVYIDHTVTPGISGPNPIFGSQVVGFSCTTNSGDTQCFVASIK